MIMEALLIAVAPSQLAEETEGAVDGRYVRSEVRYEEV